MRDRDDGAVMIECMTCGRKNLSSVPYVIHHGVRDLYDILIEPDISTGICACGNQFWRIDDPWEQLSGITLDSIKWRTGYEEE